MNTTTHTANYSTAAGARSEGRAFAEDSLDTLVREFGWGTDTFAEKVEGLAAVSQKAAEHYESAREGYLAEKQHEITSTFREALCFDECDGVAGDDH